MNEWSSFVIFNKDSNDSLDIQEELTAWISLLENEWRVG